jgi:hypothetical protein
MRKKYSKQKIGIMLFLTVGISLGLYYGLDNPNVLSYAISLDVSSDGIKKILDETEEKCYQDVSIRGQESFTTTLSCYHVDELKKLGVTVTPVSLQTEQVPIPDTQFISLPSYQPQCPIIQSIRTADVSQCNFISDVESSYGYLQMPVFISNIPTSSAQETLDELNKYGQEFYSCRGAEWTTASYSATCHGYGALNHQALATVKGYHKPYLLSQYDVLQKLVSIEKKNDDLNKLLDSGSITCDLKSTTVVDYSDGTVERFGSSVIKSAIFSLDVEPSDDNTTMKVNDKKVKDFTIIPSIYCESLPAPVSISGSNLTFNVNAQNSDGDSLLVFSDSSESKLIEISSPEEYEIMRLNLPVNSILERLNFGSYSSDIVIDVSGNIPMEFAKLQKSEIIIPENSLITTINSEVSKKEIVKTEIYEEPIIESTEPVFYLENSFIEDDWGFAVETSPTVALAGTNVVQGTTSPTEAITQFFDYLLSGDFEKLNDEKFITIYLMIMIFIVIGLLFKGGGKYLLLEK